MKTKIDIEQFIKHVRALSISCHFKSVEEIKAFEWSEKTITETEKPIIRFFTEGMCYRFAKILQDAYPGGRLCVYKNHGHIVYYYHGKVYDITGELKNKRAKYIPIEYFGDFIDDFKHCYIGGEAQPKDVKNGYKLAKANNDIIQIS